MACHQKPISVGRPILVKCSDFTQRKARMKNLAERWPSVSDLPTAPRTPKRKVWSKSESQETPIAKQSNASEHLPERSLLSNASLTMVHSMVSICGHNDDGQSLQTGLGTGAKNRARHFWEQVRKTYRNSTINTAGQLDMQVRLRRGNGNKGIQIEAGDFPELWLFEEHPWPQQVRRFVANLLDLEVDESPVRQRSGQEPWRQRYQIRPQMEGVQELSGRHGRASRQQNARSN
jgi:hypothetical protein